MTRLNCTHKISKNHYRYQFFKRQKLIRKLIWQQWSLKKECSHCYKCYWVKCLKYKSGKSSSSVTFVKVLNYHQVQLRKLPSNPKLHYWRSVYGTIRLPLTDLYFKNTINTLNISNSLKMYNEFILKDFNKILIFYFHHSTGSYVHRFTFASIRRELWI